MDHSSSDNATSSTISTSGRFSTYVGNLRSDIPVGELQDKLHSLFEAAGISVLVPDIQVIRKSWKKPSFAFVVLRDKSTFDFAVEKFNGIKNDEIVFTGKELVISPAHKQNPPQPSQSLTTTKTVEKSVRKNSKKSKHKTAIHKNKSVRYHGVAMETSTLSNGGAPTHNSSLCEQMLPNTEHSSSLMNSEPTSSNLKSFVPQGKHYFLGQKLGTEDRVTEYKQGRGNYLELQFKCDVRKYVCAFLNSEGGTLLIGVKDDCTVCGTKILNSKMEDKLRLQIDKIIKGFDPTVFPNSYSVKFIPVYPANIMLKNTSTSGSCNSSLPDEDGNTTQLPEGKFSNKAVKCDDKVIGDGNHFISQPPFNLSSPPVSRKLPPLNFTGQEDNASGLSNKPDKADSLLANNLTPVKRSGQDNDANSSLNENTLKVIEISVQPPPRSSGGQRTLYQNHKREVYIRLDGSVQGPLQASKIVEWGRNNMAEFLHMEHDYLKQQVHRKQEEITMNLQLVDDLVKQKQFLEDQYKEKENSFMTEIDKLRSREKEIEGELERVRKTKSKVCVII